MDLTLDIETYSDLDLPKVGLHAYAAHPSTRILIACWSVDGGPVATITEEPGGLQRHTLAGLLMSDDVVVHAWNAAFEVALINHCWGIDIPLERVRCDMVHGMSLSLPGSLANAGAALGLKQIKSGAGHRLINKFSKPRRPTKDKPWTRCTYSTDPDDWAEFVEYCRQDVEAERAIHEALRPYPMRDRDWAEWRLDQRVNRTGLPIDKALVAGSIAADKAGRKPLLEEAKQVTGLTNPNSVPALATWVRAQGVDAPDLTKARVRDLLLGELPEDVRRALEIRQQLGKTSVAKYQALDRATCDDGRLRGSLQFYGASRTGRWAGRIFQPQNIPRGSIKSVEELHDTVERIRSGGEATAEQLSSCIRSAVRAPEGQLIRVADLANIESRILGWIANSRRMLSCFASGGDIYRDFGQELFAMPAAELTKAQRNYSKPPTLGCFSAGTLVFTDRGWVPIVEIKSGDRLWDGVEWCAHGGVVDQGVKEVVDLWGIQATPDHLVLCGETWYPVSSVLTESGMAEQAISSGSSAFWGSMSLTPRQQADYAYAAWKLSACVGGLGRWPKTICGAVGLRDATAAPSRHQQTPTLSGPPTSPTAVSATPGSTATAPWSLGATPPPVVGGRTTVAGVSGCAASGWSTGRPFSSGSPRYQSTLTSLWSWIAATTTGGIRRITADWSPAAPTPATPGHAGMWSTWVGSTPSPGSLGAQATAALARCGASLRRALRLSRSSSGAEQRPRVRTYDLANVGPRNRFVVLTSVGPLVVHNCGYGLGADGLVAYAGGMGQEMDREQAADAVRVFRETYFEVPRLWRLLEQATKELIEFGKPGDATKVGLLTFELKPPFLFMRLPSGRRLAYYQPQVDMSPTPWGEEAPTVTYMGTDQYTRKWVRMSTFGGKWVEQACQAISRDLLAHGMALAEDSGFEVFGHTHDELQALSEEDSWLDHDVLSWCMVQPPAWADHNLHLGAEGFSDIIYRKD